MMTTHVSNPTAGNSDDADYDAYLGRINNRFLKNCADTPLFTTDVEGLWDLYLDSFEGPLERQYHNCHCCRHFIQKYGGLVTIAEDGSTKPAFWNLEDALPTYKPAVRAIHKAVLRAKVTGVFLSTDKTWGNPETGTWHHLAVRPTKDMLFKHALLSASQVMAEKLEEYKMLSRALSDYTKPCLETAVTLLKTDALYRSEKVLGQAEWLLNLHTARAAASGNAKMNVMWRAIATAPAGFCHPRSSMIGTLLEDIADGKKYEDVARAFAAKMKPTVYQRPQAAPKAGTINAAEKVIQQLNAAGSLSRRFCRLDEVKALWKPSPKKAEVKGDGVFSHLKPKGHTETPAMNMPAQTMTWDKFQRTVLPTAERIELLAPGHGNYGALVTAANPDAPPILQWDHVEHRNPVSLYVYTNGSAASNWCLRGGTYIEVDAVTLQPSMWNGGHEHQGTGIVFILRGAQETRRGGTALFPEILKAEFHGIRAVLEAHSKQDLIAGLGDPHAAGLVATKSGGRWDIKVRVWSNGKSLNYTLDRWD